ncbi:hypothetical protein AX16_009594 [Volvariella volvacea WC 439]|nr:hypothetical protein AX16_009594 [Volvariella volvacea WC 439]
MTPTLLWKTGALLATAGIIAGAFGAHGLKSRPGITADQLQSWKTASDYAFCNGLGLLALSLHPRLSHSKAPGLAIAVGSLIFSGSIVALVLNRERFRFLGPVTPLGGMIMIGGYLSLATRQMRVNSANSARPNNKALPPRHNFFPALQYPRLMVDSSARQPLITSQSFHQDTFPARSLKRSRIGSELTFFTSAASSFKPRPYAPNAINVEGRSRSSSSLQRGSRSLDTLAVPPVGMDPHPTDPHAVFIHPPFTDFPDAHLHPEGLSYPLMAENPEWFLDPADFVSPNNSNPNAIPYPPHLEPPRGWCPAKKKDLKERGAEGWPEGEEPRLRCTFCRRTYAGVNAKSMWRRHVFEKHKIAMSNRRDTTNDRARGRSSHKENSRHSSGGTIREDSHDQILNLGVTPQTDPSNVSHKSRFRSSLPSEGERDPKVKSNRATSEPSSQSEDDEPSSQIPLSPPLTPPVALPSVLAQNTEHPEPRAISPEPIAPVVPQSPYDPLQTPSFRHSPPRLPSDQPWRFPSPSHPLHSRSRELSLSMLIHSVNSPAPKLPAESPRRLAGSPLAGSVSGNTKSVFETPESLVKPRPSPRVLFSRPRFKLDKTPFRVEESPLGRATRLIPRHRRTISEFPDDWPAEPSSGFTNAGDELLSGTDTFATVYNGWTPVKNGRPGRIGDRIGLGILPEGESPILRTGKLPPVGMGIGLLEPFTLPESEKRVAEPDSDLDEPSAKEAADKTQALEQESGDRRTKSPPLKKRRTDDES